MIREFQRDDINKVADIWLDTNTKAHNFIPAEYWKSNFKSVKEALLLAEVYVYEYDTEIQGFIGLNDEYVEGIFVSGEMQTSVYKGYKRDKIEMRGDRAEISDFPLYLNTVAGGLDCRDQTIGGFSFVVKIYAVPVVEIIG